MTYRMTMTSGFGDAFLPVSLSGSEQLGHLFSYQLKLWSEDDSFDLRPLLGSPITVEYAEGDYQRYFNGIVADASRGGMVTSMSRHYTEYAVTLVPKPWLLQHKVDCRIYVNQSVPDIVKLVLMEIGYSDVQLSLSANYPKREYCVQYRETYFNFISRLLEQEGIYYFFKHAQGRHTMVLADALGAHAATPGFGTLPYIPQTAPGGVEHETAVTGFSASRSVHTTKYSLTDYDPMKPRSSLLSGVGIQNADGNHEVGGLESFDYPGAYTEIDPGNHYAQVRIEAINASQSQMTGSTLACGVLTGALFKLESFPQESLNEEYLVVGSTVQIDNPQHGAGGGESDRSVYCSFSAIRSKQPFRTLPTADRPVVVGLQTATVTGPKDEDIAVDKYGRVQVYFHWNEPEKDKAHCSCPTRVATMWAGKSWGAVSYPRVGQEVVVSFIEGDPDRPLIIGSVYNAVNMPPYDLPDNKTQSGIKSRSLLGGTADFNELRFEDKLGNEDFFIHAQKDMHEEVENDHTVTIDHDEMLEVKNDRTHNIDHDDKLTVKNDQVVVVQNNRTHKVDQEEKLTVGANSTHSITQKFKLDAGTEIELVCGTTSIKMTAGGDIEIKGMNIKIDGQLSVKIHGLQVNAEADLAASLKGLQVQVEGTAMTAVKAAMVQVTGSAMVQVGGGVLMLG